MLCQPSNAGLTEPRPLGSGRSRVGRKRLKPLPNGRGSDQSGRNQLVPERGADVNARNPPDSNRCFSPVVGVQKERGHSLITTGPYAFIRHPGYAAALGMCFASGFALGSWYSMIPMVGAGVLLLRRTVLEDAFLHVQFDGYTGYANSVRFRLIPSVWQHGDGWLSGVDSHPNPRLAVSTLLEETCPRF